MKKTPLKAPTAGESTEDLIGLRERRQLLPPWAALSSAVKDMETQASKMAPEERAALRYIRARLKDIQQRQARGEF